MDNADKLRAEIKRLGLDGFFITDPYNVRYISEFTGSDSFLVITADRNFFITDGRYLEQASAECAGYEIVNWREKELPLWETIKSVAEEAKITKLGFEAAGLSYGRYSGLSENIGFVEFLPFSGVVESLRAVKTTYEIECIKKAADIAGRAFERLLNDIRPGVTEKYLAVKLINYIWEYGGEVRPGSPSLLSGARTSLLHGKPSDKKVEYGDFVLTDFGAVYKGYNSDITKTVVVGKATDKQKEIYEVEKQAVDCQIKAVKAGISAREPYYASLAPMKDTEYLKYHYDKIGHGVGLFIHEVPFMSPKTEDFLQENNVITTEPGMYIPGWGGVRIEDMVLVKKDGCEILNKVHRDLIIV